MITSLAVTLSLSVHLPSLWPQTGPVLCPKGQQNLCSSTAEVLHCVEYLVSYHAHFVPPQLSVCVHLDLLERPNHYLSQFPHQYHAALPLGPTGSPHHLHWQPARVVGCEWEHVCGLEGGLGERNRPLVCH